MEAPPEFQLDLGLTLKLTQVTLGVERRIAYPRIRLPDVGAPYEESSLQADIRQDSSVDLLADTSVQFCLNPEETDAFRVQCVGHGGVRYSCKLDVVALGLRSGTSYFSTVEGIDLLFPAHSAEDLIRGRRGEL